MHAAKAEYSFPKVLSGDTLSFGKDRVSVLFVQFGFLHILGCRLYTSCGIGRDDNGRFPGLV